MSLELCERTVEIMQFPKGKSPFSPPEGIIFFLNDFEVLLRKLRPRDTSNFSIPLPSESSWLRRKERSWEIVYVDDAQAWTLGSWLVWKEVGVEALAWDGDTQKKLGRTSSSSSSSFTSFTPSSFPFLSSFLKQDLHLLPRLALYSWLKSSSWFCLPSRWDNWCALLCLA